MVNRAVVAVALGVGCLLAQAAAPLAGQGIRLNVDAASSHVAIDVGKAGVFGFAGHAHEVVAPVVRGSVTLDAADWQQSEVALEFDAAALRVSGTGEPPADVPQVQQVMLSDRVLDARRFTTIAFKSRRVRIVSGQVGAADVQIDGDVTLRGVTRPLSVRARATLDGAGTLTTRGTFSLKQTDFGIEPVTAAGGSIRVRDAVDVRFVLVAHR